MIVSVAIKSQRIPNEMEGKLQLSLVTLVWVIWLSDAKWTCNQTHQLAFEDSCYYFNLIADREFEEFENYCQEEFTGGHLASIHSEIENNVLSQYYVPRSIGLHKGNEKWVWSDGTPVDYVNWKNPDEDHDDSIYAYLFSDYISPDNGKWVKTK